MSRVRVLKVSHVPIQPSPIRLPERVELSFFDALWMSLPPLQRLLLFHGAPLPPIPALLDSLRAALSRALLPYFTLAGKLTYLPASGDAAIDCSPAAVKPGVAFLEAEADADDLGRLCDDEIHDGEAFHRLVPALDVSELPAPAFAVQATAFVGAEGAAEGVAVGFAFHHAVADGRAIWEFVMAWAAESRGESPQPPLPTVDRAVVRDKHPRADEIGRLFLSRLAPSLPKTKNPPHSSNLKHMTLVVSPQRIQMLKQRAKFEPPPSAFVSIAARAWISFARAKALDGGADTYVIFVADCREHLDPPILPGRQNYFGNCVKICIARAVAGDITGEEEEGGHERACRAIQRAVEESSLKEDPMADCGVAWLEGFESVDLSRALILAASPRFAVYDLDFGWGRPSRVELVSMRHDGQIALSKARDGEGVQVTAAFQQLHLGPFVKHFLGS